MLARWLHGWVQPSGAIHGFHNHSVWGQHPACFGDDWAGHATFAAPLIPAIARALAIETDPRGEQLLRRLVNFQCTCRQADGQFDHVGFQIGEAVKGGLIHNVVPCVALVEALAEAPEPLASQLAEQVDAVVRSVLAACDRRYGPGTSEHSTANQEYCRAWARLLHMQVFDHGLWHDQVRGDIEALIDGFHHRGLPDDQSVGVFRSRGDQTLLEPAEYYGLMIAPLRLAARRYGEPRYLDEASSIARHVVRSAWRDGRECLRVHRLWHNGGGTWRRITEPMLIGGIGLTLDAVASLADEQPDKEIAGFLQEMDRTYNRYQSGAGLLLSATGWHHESDVIPSTAWQSHDLLHLVRRHGVEPRFWDTVFSPLEGVAVVLGDNAVWTETSAHFALRGYVTGGRPEYVGRKDTARFALDIPGWIAGERSPDHLRMPDEPRFIRADDVIIQISGREDIIPLYATHLRLLAPYGVIST